ncbi:MAG: ABC transporter permease [Bacillota bacterium]
MIIGKKTGMKAGMVIKLALASIFSNKMRSFLTMLGIIIGTSAVIILVTLAQATTDSVTENIEGMGTNILSVSIMGSGNDTSLDYEDSLEIANIEGVDSISPIVSGQATLKYELNSTDITIEGADEGYAPVRGQNVSSGRFIHFLDIENRHKVILIGTEVSEDLFGFADPLGEQVKVNGTNFTVIGVLEKSESTIGGSSNDKALIPISTAERFFKSPGVKSINIQAESPEAVADVQAQAELFLLRMFNNDQEAYRILNQTDMLSTIGEVTAILTMMLGGIAGISLVVGGIGIMNIMLVSVTERTREIGIRKAIGAKRKDILSQFIIEAAVISGIGGLIGVVLGIIGSYIISNLMGLQMTLIFSILIISFLFSLAIGMFFGIYPANKASRLKPVDALMYE